ncbi:MAG: hypothetical protein DI543_12490 [Bradyrhizobium icense]|nr:MAG: hypothetical protein DI543_12490 [Bradyrhizobium icense]
MFSQLVAFSMPSNFVAGYEKTNGATYTREAVPKGDTLQKWTEMITVTGAKGLAATASAEKFAGSIAGGFQRACPDSFAAKGAASKIGGLDAFVAVVGCGKVGGGADLRSETALIVAIKGAADIYTVQWAERGSPSGKPDVENARWQERLKQLGPIRLCAIMPGEKAPYPSCLGKP